jgi:hypothetical protein
MHSQNIIITDYTNMTWMWILDTSFVNSCWFDVVGIHPLSCWLIIRPVLLVQWPVKVLNDASSVKNDLVLEITALVNKPLTKSDPTRAMDFRSHLNNEKPEIAKQCCNKC